MALARVLFLSSLLIQRHPMKFFCTVLVFFLFSGLVLAQDLGFDTAYIEQNHDKMILRTYLSRKYTNLDLGEPQGLYEPNSGLNFGVGVTFQKFTLNIGVPLSFLNPDRKEDWPGFLDLQSHAYPQNWIIDLFGQFYNGYFIRDFKSSGEDYLRKDLRVVKLGASASYLFNGEKLSFEAAFHQSEIQKKSAISPMVGFEVYRSRISGDSLVVPGGNEILGNFNSADFWQIGPNVGFAGTLVFGKGFFLSGAASGNAGLGIAQADKNSDTRSFAFKTGYFLRGFAGYNGERYSVNISYVYKNLDLENLGTVSPDLNTGNYRLNLVYKLNPGPKLVKTYTKLNPLQILQRMFD